MRLFKNESEARESLSTKDIIYTNGLCPYSDAGRLCGSWCALFYFDKADDKRSSYIILGCKGTDKKLHV
jgi:hypothetical protein